MDKFKEIRPIILGIVKKDNKIPLHSIHLYPNDYLLDFTKDIFYYSSKVCIRREEKVYESKRKKKRNS